jgi:protein-disulfide isomerase
MKKNIIITSCLLLLIVIISDIIWMNSSAKETRESEPSIVKLQIWTKGNPEAKIVLEEYSDFQCPACGAYDPIIKQLTREFGSNIQFTYRHFPLRQIHTNADLAARAAEAAGMQGKFWEMHDTLFEHQKEWSNSGNAKEDFVNYAQKLGLDAKRFISDLDSKEVKEKVDSDQKSGERLGVNSTPTFLLNGEEIQNPRSYEEFKNLLQNVITQQ